MLQQILRDMWVDPEILAELDETQKQTLFCKMREEQVRRWQQWDQEVSREEVHRPKKSGSKQVQFLQGEDGEPWVWVMGEHPNDKSIASILSEEARRQAVAQAREEALQLRKSVEKELTQLIHYQPRELDEKFDLSPKSVDSLEETLEIYCTADEIRQRIEELEPEVLVDDKEETDYRNERNLQMDGKNSMRFNFIEGKRDVLQDLGLPNGGDGVSDRIASWERRVAAARAGDILRGLRARRAKVMRDAQLNAKDDDDAWREQERRAKEAEAAMRQIVRAAREVHRRQPAAAAAQPPLAATHAGTPPNKEVVVEWFRTHELKKGVGLDADNKPVDWFHGLISRSEAESILSSCAAGSFLVRLSARAWCYALSHRGVARVRHYLVETDGDYRLLGAPAIKHATLAELISHHSRVPITEVGGELLTTPCPPQHTPEILLSDNTFF